MVIPRRSFWLAIREDVNVTRNRGDAWDRSTEMPTIWDAD